MTHLDGFEETHRCWRRIPRTQQELYRHPKSVGGKEQVTHLEDIFENILDYFHRAASHNVHVAVKAKQQSGVVGDDMSIVRENFFLLLDLIPIGIFPNDFSKLKTRCLQIEKNLQYSLPFVTASWLHVTVLPKRCLILNKLPTFLAFTKKSSGKFFEHRWYFFFCSFRQ